MAGAPDHREPAGRGRRRQPSGLRRVDRRAPRAHGAGRRRGPETSRRRHVERGKLLPRDRVDGLLDPGSPFLELSPLAANGMYDDESPAAGHHHRHRPGQPAARCVIVANDATVKGGTYYPMTVKKHLRAQEIALENRLAVRLPGRLRRCVPARAGRGVPRPRALRADLLQPGADVGGGHRSGRRRDGIVHGRRRLRAGDERRGGHRARPGHDLPRRPAAGAGGHRRDRHGRGTRWRQAPRPTPRAWSTTSPTTTATRCGSSGRSSRDPAAARRRRGRPSTSRSRWSIRATLTAVVPADSRIPYDVREVIARIVDGSRFHEFKREYGATLVTGFAHIWGHPVGIVANNGVLFCESALKGAHFIELCDQRGIPLLFLQNITGFMVGRDYEAGGIAKHGAKMVTAVACARVPKLTVIIGGSFGAGNYSMCGRAYSPRFLWTWPNARISVMGGEQAASVLATVRREQLERRSGRRATPGRGRRRTRRRSRPRSGPSTRPRETPTTPRPGCGTTASSSPVTPGWSSGWPSVSSQAHRSGPSPTACSGCDEPPDEPVGEPGDEHGDDTGDVLHRARGQPWRDRRTGDAHPADDGDPLGRRVQRRRRRSTPRAPRPTWPCTSVRPPPG